jgi:hypothetical protein
MNRIILQDCRDIVRSLAGTEALYFDQAVEIRTTPHTPPFRVWAVSVSPADRLYVMDQEEQWYPLDLSDDLSDLMIGSLYQRLSLMRINYAKAS